MATQKEAGATKAQLVAGAEAEVNRLVTQESSLLGQLRVAKALVRSLLQQGVSDSRLDDAYLRELDLEAAVRQTRADTRRARAGAARARQS